MIESTELLHKHKSKIDTNYYNDKLHSQIYTYFEYVGEYFVKNEEYYPHIYEHIDIYTMIYIVTDVEKNLLCT